MKKVLLLGLLPALLSFSSCGRRIITGKGETTTTNAPAQGDFTAVEVSAPVVAHVHVRPGAQATVRFTGYKNLIDELDTRVEGNTLYIDNRDPIEFATDKDLIAEITVPALTALEVDGAGDATVNGNVTGDALRLGVSGAGSLTVEKVTVGNLKAKISGAGNLDIHSGSANSAEYKVSGAGNISCFGVRTADVRARVSGAGDIDVYAERTLEAKISGAGNVKYKGAASVKSETSGAGSIVAAN